MTQKTLLSGASLITVLALSSLAPLVRAENAPIALPTGQTITPLAAPGSAFQGLNPGIASAPDFLAGQAETTAVSPDGKTLLVLTSGYNLSENKDTTGEWVFVFDISTGLPNQSQALKIPNAFSGLVWASDGSAFYVAGGQDDNVHIFTKNGGQWAESNSPIALNHTAYGVPQPAGNGLFSLPGFGAATSPLAAGLGITADGKTLIVANLENDSISLVDLVHGVKSFELDLRPGRSNPAQSGVPGGEFPFWIAVNGDARTGRPSDTVYVSSERDREIVVVSLSGGAPHVKTRIAVKGNPNRLVLNRAQTRLYVTADNEDALHVISTLTNRVVASVNTVAPAGAFDTIGRKGDDAEDGDMTTRPKGASPNSVSLSPDEKIAYVTNGGTNSVAVIDIASRKPEVTGLIPTGWYPNSVSVSADGRTLYVVNSKSPSGPNPQYPHEDNTYVLQLIKGGLLTLPVPKHRDLAALTATVVQNNGFAYAPTAADQGTIRFLRKHIQHVIYIVKENRTYDQILGDLPMGNGDPTLTMYPQATTPNFHAIASNFVDLDNFYVSGEVSMDGWQWSTAGRGIDLNEKVVTVNYGKGGGSYDSEGTSRDVCTALKSPAERVAADPVYGLQAITDSDLLPGTDNEVAADGPRSTQEDAIDDPSGERGAGYIWNAALRADLSVRNYGFFEDGVRYEAPPELGGVPVLRDPYATKTTVAFPCDPALLTRTDPYFRGFDDRLPDFYRYQEWAREFDLQVSGNNFPAFETVRLMNDHTGNFDKAIDGVDTPELQQADNDYAVALLVDKIAHSRYANSTLIFVLEDDSQDGPDHVDTHRSTGYVVGPYVKQGAVVSTRYATVNMLRTIGDVLGLEPLSLNVASVGPMTDVFDITRPAKWAFNAVPSTLLYGTQLPLPPMQKADLGDSGAIPRPLHDAVWWAEKTRGYNFAKADINNADAFNRVLWEGTMGDKPYPTTRSGADLRHNRVELLKAAGFEPPALEGEAGAEIKSID